MNPLLLPYGNASEQGHGTGSSARATSFATSSSGSVSGQGDGFRAGTQYVTFDSL